MNSGIFGEGFPYSNFHDLNMDWIIKIAKDFLNQYTNIQNTIAEGLEDLNDTAERLTNLLQEWYDTHSQDIANQLASALADLNSWYNTHQNYLDQTLAQNILVFNQRAEQKANEVIASIPSDYTTLSNKVTALETNANDSDVLIGDFTRTLQSNARWPFIDIPLAGKSGDIVAFQLLSYEGTTSNLETIYIIDPDNNIDYHSVATPPNMWTQVYKTLTHDCTKLRVIARQRTAETPSMRFQMFIVNNKSLVDIQQFQLMQHATFSITQGTALNVSKQKIEASIGDIIMVKCVSNLISVLDIGYTSNNVNVDNFLKLDILNGLTCGYGKITNLCDLDSLRFYITPTGVLGTGSITIQWINISKLGVIVPGKYYSNFSVLGDSYSTYKGYTTPIDSRQWYPTSDPSTQGYGTGNNVDALAETWWYQLANDTELYLDKNVSYSGSTICYDSYGTGEADGMETSFIYRAENLTPVSLLLIYGGLNDYWAGASIGEYKYSDWTVQDLCTFAPALAYLIVHLKSRLVGTDLIFMEDESLSSEYKTAIETVCDHYSVPVIKLHGIEKTSSHPNQVGMARIRNQVRAFLCKPNTPFYA